jgi:hypothetical protein
MQLVLKRKKFGGIYTCIPGFVNINLDGRVMVNEGDAERAREMIEYDVYINPYDKWMDLTYAYNEGFLDSNQLKNWK